MNKYIAPKMSLKVFERENTVTASASQDTAVQQAQAAAENISGKQKVFTVTW